MLLDEEGLESAWARHRALAGAVWAAIDVWGQAGEITPNVPDATHRGWSVTAARIGGGKAGYIGQTFPQRE